MRKLTDTAKQKMYDIVFNHVRDNTKWSYFGSLIPEESEYIQREYIQPDIQRVYEHIIKDIESRAIIVNNTVKLKYIHTGRENEITITVTDDDILRPPKMVQVACSENNAIFLDDKGNVYCDTYEGFKKIDIPEEYWS